MKGHPIIVKLWKIGPSYSPKPPTEFDLDLNSFTSLRDAEYTYSSLADAQIAYAASIRAHFEDSTNRLMAAKADTARYEKNVERIREEMLEAERIAHANHD